jgi:FtsP/CotA-like multicopper oxidase with cupredoxin domain
MKRIISKRNTLISFLVTFSLLIGGVTAHAVFIPGTTGPNFNLTAKTGFIYADDGKSIFMWGYANGTPATSGRMQYPGPTLIVNQNEIVSITLHNQLPGVNCSIVFPGQTNVAIAGGVAGLLTNEAIPGGNVTYSFVASQPGTYTYYSATRPELQVEMGLVGALIVRPTGAGFGPSYGYNHADSAFDHEYLFLLSEIDPVMHKQVELGQMALINNTTADPIYWFINGRAGFDTLGGHNTPSLPSQPYGALARAHPGERVLVRMIGAGRDLHPFHLHGNHHQVIAKDGRMLKGPLGEDLSEFAFTTTVGPGQTFDAIFTWTGEGLGWDIYGHTDPAGLGRVGAACPTPLQPNEPEADHCRPVPVTLPPLQDLTFGPLYSGSPLVGSPGPLPPGEGGFNPNSGLPFMWHSHSEKELTSGDIFPGGMLTFIIVEHPSVPIP